jgi:hypothetical protein
MWDTQGGGRHRGIKRARVRSYGAQSGLSTEPTHRVGGCLYGGRGGAAPATRLTAIVDGAEGIDINQAVRFAVRGRFGNDFKRVKLANKRTLLYGRLPNLELLPLNDE